MNAAMVAGTDPQDARVRPLAERWRQLVREFTGGDPNMERKVRAAFVAEPRFMRRKGPSPDLFTYANRAIRSLD